MKLSLNRPLRAALLSCYALTASIATTLPIATVATGIVTFSLLSEQAEAEQITVTRSSSGQLTNRDIELTATGDSIVMDFTAGWIGGGEASWIAPTIYIKNWTQDGASGNESMYAKGNLTDYSVNDATFTGEQSDIILAVAPSDVLKNDYIFDGNQSAFSGDFILAMSSENGRDFVFTYSTDYADVAQSNVTGTGAITMERRANNTYDGNAHFYYSGAVTIGNSVISANALTLNAKSTGAAGSSNDYKTSHTSRDATGGATYTISSVLALGTLEINDGSTAILTGKVVDTVMIQSNSTVGVVSFAGASSLQVGNGAHLTLTGVQAAGGDNLSILEGGQLTINGRLNLSSAIANAGTLAFGAGGQLDLSAFTAESIAGGYAYQIFTEGSLGLLDLANLTWENVLGISGLSADSSISYASGKLSITGVLAALSYTGSDNSSAPASLNWNAEGAFDGAASFNAGQAVNFSGHTAATITVNTKAGAIAIADQSSLSINAAADITFSAASVVMEGSSQMSIGVATLDTSDTALSLTGGSGATFRLDGDGTQYNLADVVNLSSYTGEISVNNATVVVANASDFGTSGLVTLGEGSVLSTSGVSLGRRLHVAGNAVLTNTGGAIEMSAITGDAAHTLTISGMTNIYNNMEFAGKLVIASGTTQFGRNQNSVNTIAASSITIEAGAQFTVSHNAGSFSATDINLHGGSVDVADSSAATLHGDDMGAGAITLGSGALNLAGKAVANDVTVSGGSISGFSAYAGTVSIGSTVTVTDTITGGINVLTRGDLTLSGTWDYSSAISNEGNLTFGSGLSLQLTESDFTQTDGTYSLTLFSGGGSNNLDSWLDPSRAVATGKIAGISTEGKIFSYNAGILSYTLGYYIPDTEQESIAGGNQPSIDLDGPTAQANLGDGSVLTMRNSVLAVGSTIHNASASLRLVDHTMQVSSVAAGGNLTVPSTKQQITAQGGGEHGIYVYTLTSISVADVEFSSSLVLDIVLTATDYAAFAQYVMDGEYLTFELDGVAKSAFDTLSYSNVAVNVYNGNLETLGQTLTPLGLSSNGAALNAVLYVPEPSTATLSLLALAGLLARRRRKKQD